MQVNKEFLEENLRNLINRKVTRAKLSFGSFFRLDFGKDIEISVPTSKGVKKHIRGEWEISVYMAFWEFEKHGKIVLHSESERENIEAFFKTLGSKVLLNFEITSDQFDLTLQFEDDIDLYLIANNEEDDNEQWNLFIPDGRVLIAGPDSKITCRLASSSS